MKTGYEFELTLDDAGNVSLTQGDEVVWASDQDDEFKEEWGAVDITGDELDELASWLVDCEILPPGVEVHFIDEIGGDDWVDNVDATPPDAEFDDEDADDETGED